MLYVISHDIPDDRRRAKVAKILRDFGQRVQYSVFEAELDENLLSKLRNRLKNAIIEQEDSIRVYRICKQCKGLIEILGEGTVTEDLDVYIV